MRLRELTAEDLDWVVERHGALYAEEQGWDESFRALVEELLRGYLADRDPAREAGWIAELDGERAGSVVCTASDTPGVARLRMLLVEPHARGHGIGTRLVDRCIAFAREVGYTRLELWTTASLTAARRLYDAAGFEVERRTRERRWGAEIESVHMRLEL